MEAPEKIWINPTLDLPKLNGVLDIDSVEYIRTDAFIEKALKFLDGCIPDYIELKHANADTFMDIDNERFIKDFINHIKGK